MADNITNEEINEEVIIIELTDDEGVTTEFEYLDTISFEGEEYVVLIENVEEADGVIILKIVSVDDETETYEGVEDEDTVQKVYEIFRENRKDDFDFTD